MLIQESLTLQQKLEILSDAAKYDVACTSSGVDRKGKSGTMGNTAACGICHSFGADGRCISLLKILMTNACIYDCKYCLNRVSNDTVRTFFTPEEICTLTMEFYRRNYIEGLFLSSGILRTPNETMERMYQALWTLREIHGFWGYIHIKAIPGADPELIERVGHLADRMSINLELPTGSSLKTLAPAKTRSRILTPMRQIQNGIYSNHLMLGTEKRPKKNSAFTLPKNKSASCEADILSDQRAAGASPKSSFSSSPEKGRRGSKAKQTFVLRENGNYRTSTGSSLGTSPTDSPQNADALPSSLLPPGQFSSMTDSGIALPGRPGRLNYSAGSSFVPAGQSTQMIIGATPDTDHQILSVTEALYQHFDLKRVFFSAYTALNEDAKLPALGTPPPLLREHRLYQADWLLRFYGFSADELLSEEKPYFNLLLDPKCDWALRHLDKFPMEINRADYTDLLRIPGIGVKSARRIIKGRRYGSLDFDALKKFGVVLKRAGFFITCGGKTCRSIRLNEDYLTNELVSAERKKSFSFEDPHGSFRQMSLFDDFHLAGPPVQEDLFKSFSGQL